MIIFILIVAISPVVILLSMAFAVLILFLLEGGDPIKVKANQARRIIDFETDSFLNEIQIYLKKEKENEQ